MVENTYKKKLIDYIKKNLRKGYHTETLRVALINQNYSRSTIDEAIKDALREMALEVPAIKEKPQIEHEIVAEMPEAEAKPTLWRRLIDFFKR
jgi:hypothetical protein